VNKAPESAPTAPSTTKLLTFPGQQMESGTAKGKEAEIFPSERQYLLGGFWSVEIQASLRQRYFRVDPQRNEPLLPIYAIFVAPSFRPAGMDLKI